MINFPQKKSRLWALLVSSFVLSSCVSTKQAYFMEPPPIHNPFTQAPPQQSSQVLTTIAFGSCNRQNLAQDHWDAILKSQAELWIWAGDNVYADTEDPRKLAKVYETQLAHPEYQRFLKQLPIIGIWDDHDYAYNDAGKEARHKKASQQLFLDFVGEPKDSLRRQQEGIYHSYLFGPKGQQIKIILLDTRYHRERPGRKRDILGEEQWQWLEKELSNSEANLHLIVSGIQILPVEHRFEKWQDFPAARKRLFELLKKSNAARPILLSGDRHIAEIIRLPQEESGLSYDLWEVTASGLTHSWESLDFEKNRYRSGELFTGKNFGLIKIHWETAGPEVELEIRDLANKTRILHKI